MHEASVISLRLLLNKEILFAPKLVPLDEAEAFTASSPNCSAVKSGGNSPQWSCPQMDER